MFPSSYLGGDGIYSGTTDDNLNQNRLRVYSPNANQYHNLFYAFRNAIECSNTFQIIGRDNYIINKTIPVVGGGPGGPPPIPSTYGWYGYNIQTSKYDTISIVNDTITNLNTGIAIWENGDPTTTMYPISHFAGYGWIYGNLIQASPYGYSSGMSQSVSTGIAIQCATTKHNAYTDMNKMTVNMNYLHDVYNGIYLNNMWQQSNVEYNNISVRPNTASPHWLQFGINSTLSENSLVYENNITSTPAPGAGSDSLRAFYTASCQSNLNQIGCNSETGLGRGYEFFMNNMGVSWFNNNMNKNLKGFVLNAASIGPQYPSGTYPMGDQWQGTWGSGDTQTYVYHGANAINSKFYLTGSSSITNPTLNSGAPGFASSDYLLGTSIFYVPGTTIECHPLVHRMDSVYDQIAQQQILFESNLIPNNWIGQYALWNSILSDTTLVDSSAALAVFASLAQSSRYAYITTMENLLINGNYDSVTTMLGYNIDSMANTSWDSVTQVRLADSTGADNIVQNYQNFFGLFMKYATASLSSSDSLAILALAQLCPERNGTVVFQARSLYSQIYNDLSMFNDDSCLDVDSGYVAARHSDNGNNNKINATTGNQNYSIHPNPNDGNFVLLQYIPDNEPVKIRIYDEIGRSIYNQDLQFSNSKGQLNLVNYVPGIYLLEITDGKNRIFRFKFVINK